MLVLLEDAIKVGLLLCSKNGWPYPLTNATFSKTTLWT